MKRCIWCNKTEQHVTFNSKAHTIPQGLGGTAICENVCDACNFYFGNRQDGMPAIELVIKETFNLSKARLLTGNDQVGKNKVLPRYTSEYFTLDSKRNKIDIKPKYSVRRGFQENLCRQIKRGLYKIFLEENERTNGNSLDDKYNFIREFARYGIGDYPVYYFERSSAIIFTGQSFLKHPHRMFNEMTMNYILRDYGFFEVEFFGHVLSLATTRHWNLGIEKYLVESIKLKGKYFRGYKMIQKWNDIDIPLSIFDRQ